MTKILEGTNSFGTNGVHWFIGQVAPRESWASNALQTKDKDHGKEGGDKDIASNRVKLNIVGKTDNITDGNELPWAHVLSNPMANSGYGNAHSFHKLEGGESVLGFYLDGDDEQTPVISNVFYRDPRSADQTENIKGGEHQKPHALKKKSINEEQTGDVVGKDVSTSADIKDKKFSKKNSKFNKNDGNPKGDTKEPVPTNESSKKDSTTTASTNVEEKLGRVSVESPATCKNDNMTGAITGALGDFSKLLMNVESYGDFYVNKLTGRIVDLESEIDLAAKKIGGYMTATTNGIRDALFSDMEDKISSFTNNLVPEELKSPFGEAVKGIADEVHCLFGNMISGLKGVISGFLKDLVGNLINAPLCAAEQFVGTLLNNIMGGITSTIGPILSSLTGVLGGALGSVNSMVNKALAGVGILYNFIGCDDHKCPLPSRFDVGIGPQQKERDNMDKLMKSASLLNLAGAVPGLGGLVSSVKGATENIANIPSVFKKSGDGTPGSLLGTVGGCESNVLRCGPPKIEFFGGAGVGGFANAVVNETGQIIGANMVDGGLGFTKERPPYVTFKDTCGDGSGARGKAIIGDDGTITNVLMEKPGYGYNNLYGKIKTIYGDVESDAISYASNSDTAEVTGQIDSATVTNSGYGYNSTDTIEAGNGSVLKPIVLAGRLMGIEVIDGGVGFTKIPELFINSETGQGANLRVALKFTPVAEVIKPLDSDEIISVVNCVGKPLTSTPIS